MKTYLILSFIFLIAYAQELPKDFKQYQKKTIDTYQRGDCKFLEKLAKEYNYNYPGFDTIINIVREKLNDEKLKKLRRISLYTEYFFTGNEQTSEENVYKAAKESMINFLIKAFEENRDKLEGFLKLFGNNYFSTGQEFSEKIRNELNNQDYDYIKEFTQEFGEIFFDKKYIKKLEKEEIIKYILKKVEENRERLERFFKEEVFNKEDTFQNLNTQTYFEKNENIFGGGLGDYLQASDKDHLIKICYAIENYTKTSSDIMGGLHDFINGWDEHRLREYILEKVKLHPELDNVEKIEGLINNKNELGYLAEKGFDLKNDVEKHIYTLNKDNLSKLAIQLENYHRKENGQENFLGGIHDYIFNLNDEEIRNYIMKEIKEHADLNNLEKLNSLNN
jgi:hypothetical protein